MDILSKIIRNKNLRNRLLFTLISVVILRLGVMCPIPLIKADFIRGILGESVLGSLANVFSGGALENFSILSFGITPYITASIVIQLMTIVIPRLEQMQTEGGAVNQEKLGQITKITALALSGLQALFMAIGFGRNGYFSGQSFVVYPVMIISMVAGTAFLIWFADVITDKGIGNGTSIILFVNIVSRVPSDMLSIWEVLMNGKTIPVIIVLVIVVAVIIFAIVSFIVALEGAVHNLKVQYSSKVAGNSTHRSAGSNMPIKLNIAGVIPVIFAASIMDMPRVFVSLFNGGNSQIGIVPYFTQGNWFRLSSFKYTLGVILYIVLVVFFAYYYTSITFNPKEIAGNLKRHGGTLIGIRPGAPTVDYLKRILRYLVFCGAVGLLIAALVPMIINGLLLLSLSMGGTSLIIIVGVALELAKQVQVSVVTSDKGRLLSL